MPRVRTGKRQTNLPGKSQELSLLDIPGQPREVIIKWWHGLDGQVQDQFIGFLFIDTRAGRRIARRLRGKSVVREPDEVKFYNIAGQPREVIIKWWHGLDGQVQDQFIEFLFVEKHAGRRIARRLDESSMAFIAWELMKAFFGPPRSDRELEK